MHTIRVKTTFYNCPIVMTSTFDVLIVTGVSLGAVFVKAVQLDNSSGFVVEFNHRLKFGGIYSGVTPLLHLAQFWLKAADCDPEFV